MNLKKKDFLEPFRAQNEIFKDQVTNAFHKLAVSKDRGLKVDRYLLGLIFHKLNNFDHWFDNNGKTTDGQGILEQRVQPLRQCTKYACAARRSALRTDEMDFLN